MIARPPLPPGPHLVVGLARSGVAVALALRARGEVVVGCDGGAVAPAARAALEAAGVVVHARTDGTELVAAAATVVKSPGVPPSAAVVRAARSAGRLVVGELEIGWRLLLQPFVAVTGSNGKTTTVELIGHLHRSAGCPVAVAGNVGTPLSSLAGRLPATATVVCEASSFQLEDADGFAPEAGVLLNLAADHLDRHGTFERYREAKLALFAHQGPEAIAVLPDDLALPDAGGAARRVRFGSAPGSDLVARDGWLRWQGTPLMPTAEIRLRGAHNLANAMAAAAVCLARDLPAEAVRAGLSTFAGVPHRLEEVGTVDDVLYVNDSKATNVASAAVGLSSFPGRVHAILGGRGKGADFTGLATPLARVAVAGYLVGEAAPALRRALASVSVPVHDCGDLATAVAAARAAARPGDVVLLSPACASFDQYASFEERGAHFRALVEAGRAATRIAGEPA